MDDLIAVRLRLQGARQFMAEAGAAAKAVALFGVAGEEAAAKTRLTNAETFAWRQGLFTLRRELFYATAAAGAFAVESLRLGFSFDEAKRSGTEAFAAIFGSSRIASQEMSTLVGLTHATGLQLGTLVGTAEQMQGFGFTLKAVNTDMAALAQFAERSGRGLAGFSSLVEVFDRIRQSGRLTSLDLRSLTAQGVPALSILGSRLHLTAQQQAMLRAGRLQIPAQYALPALAGGIGARAGQLGTNLGQQFGVTRSYLASLLGGGEQGIFGFATRGLEHVNAALQARSQGGSFLSTLDPSGRLLLGWHLLGAAIHGAIAPFAIFFGLGQRVARQFPILGGLLAFVARQTWLVQGAMFALATWFAITRTRMLLFALATKIVGAVETGYIVLLYALDAAAAAAAGGMALLNIALDANPIILIGLAVVALGFGLYELVKHADAVGHAFVVAFHAVKEAVKSALNFIIGAWDWLADKLTVPGFSVFGHKFGGHSLLPHIPKLDDGGYISRTGLAVVHRGETYSGVGGSYGSFDYTKLAAALVGALDGARLIIDDSGSGVAKLATRTAAAQKIIANGVLQAQSAVRA